MENWLRLQGKVVIVTGGAGGIGHAVAEEFLADGAKVAVCDIKADPRNFKGAGKDNFLYVKADVRSKEQVDAMAAEVLKRFGTIDVLVNNAGVNIPRLLVDEAGKYELDDAVWDEVMSVNLRGVFYCAQAAARTMKANKSGVIVNISSECGLEGSEGQSVYAASKAAVNALTRSWAKELGKFGVRVVGIAPGILEATGLRTLAYETALAYTRGITIEQLREGYNKTNTTPMGRCGKLAEVAAAVAYMASEKAAYVDGVTLNVAGGKTRG